MRLAISNIAWDPSEDVTIATLLQTYRIDAIDVAPGKYFPDPLKATDAQIQAVRAWWAGHGIAITGMQSLLFGTSGLNVFGSETSRQAMISHLDAICRIGAGLGASHLVFGSPKNRDRAGLDDATVTELALSFFTKLADIASAWGVKICLEPNPTQYGANFLTTTSETARMVRQIAHPAIMMQLDTGALALNGEDAGKELADCAALVGHVHASEPDLVPLGDGDADHARNAMAVREYLPLHTVSIEMLATREEPHSASIERALHTAQQWYGDAISRPQA